MTHHEVTMSSRFARYGTMRSLIPITALAVVRLFASAQPGGLAKGAHADSVVVAAVINRYHRALSDGDTVTALALLTNDAMILESGDVETREEYRSHHLPADIAFARAVPSVRRPIRVVMHSDAAWAISTAKNHGTYRGRTINSQGAELMVLTREAGRWKIRAIHWSSHALRPSR